MTTHCTSSFRAALSTALFVSAMLAAPAPASAAPTPHPGSVSLGVGFGDPTAIDMKFWAGQGSGLNLGVGLHRFSDRLGLYVEYEFGIIDFWIGDSIMSAFYVGVGGAVALRSGDDDTSAALVVPIGLNFRFRAPVEIFVEARPGVALLNHSGFGLGGSAFGVGGQVGVRYVF